MLQWRCSPPFNLVFFPGFVASQNHTIPRFWTNISNEWMIGINLWNHYCVSFGGFSRHPVVKILVLDNGWFFFPKFGGEHFKKQLSMRQFLHSNMLWTPSCPPKMGWTAKRAPPLPLKHICCVKDEPAWVFGHFMRILSSFSQGWSVLIFLSTSSWGCAPPGENASGFFGSTFGLRSLSRKWRPKMNGNGISIINVVSMWSHKGVCWKTKARQTICKFSENLLKSQGVMSKFFIWCPMIHRTSVKSQKKTNSSPLKMGRIPKGIDRLPTIRFSWPMLVSGSVSIMGI